MLASTIATCSSEFLAFGLKFAGCPELLSRFSFRTRSALSVLMSTSQIAYGRVHS